ncbi:MAG: hypothetical protein Q9186_001848 [Xanthomendoza sp. 1 TL-2023]
MAFVQTFPSEVAPPTGIDSRVSIVCVPAIGADPRATWSIDPLDHHAVLQQLHRLLPFADIVLYDHLLPDERGIEIKTQKDAGHKSTAVAFAAAEERVAQYGIPDLSDQYSLFVTAQGELLSNRYVIAIHHIGYEWPNGVMKALSQKVDGGLRALASSCIGIVFFGESFDLFLLFSYMLMPGQACPHHGSSVLSGPEYAQSIRGNLQLKWQMSEKLRQSLSLASEELRILNYNFAKAAVGIRIFSYIETRETELKVLSSNDASGEFLIRVHVCIVAERSALLNTAECSVEEEEVVGLNLTHTAFPRFQEETLLCTNFAKKIAAFVRSLDAGERAAHAALVSSIVDGILVDVHQFYEIGEHEATASMKIWSAQPSLRNFWKYGPDACLKQRLKKPETSLNLPLASSLRPRLGTSPASEPIAPTITVAPALTTDVGRDEQTAFDVSREKPLRRPSNPDPPLDINELSDTIRTLKPNGKNTKSTLTHGPYDSTGDLLGPPDLPPSRSAFSTQAFEKSQPSQRSHTYQLPSVSTDRFRWVHVPCTHAGWVPHTLTSISQEQEKLDLHAMFLHDQLWLSQHNRSRHASHHAQFIRPSIKCLLPEGSQAHHPQGIMMPLSACTGIQLVLYMPYLHWDSFEQLRVRATTIKRRMQQENARPTDHDIATGQSLEKTVVTFATPKEKEDDGDLSDQGDLRDNVYKDVNGDYARRCSDPFDFAALVVFHAVRAILENTHDPSLQVFRIFELRDPGDIDVRRLPKYVDNRTDLDALLELRDIEDELGTIQKLLKEQHSTIKDMLTYYKSFTATKSSGTVGKNGVLLLQTVDHNIKEYRGQIDSMLNSARAAQTAFKELLDMKQKQANIVEAHLAREQTEVAADQSRSVMIFTIFTIIFLPLSFFASVFGINAREWSGESHNLGIHTIFVYMGCISLAVIVVALLVAFNKHTRRLAQKAWQMSARPIQRRWMKAQDGVVRKQEHDEKKKRLVKEGSKTRRFSTLTVLTEQWTGKVSDEEAGTKSF